MTTSVLEYEQGPAETRRPAAVRLSIMMLLQYAVWGVWLPYLASYLQAPRAGGGLGFSGTQIGWILGTAASLGALAAPFIAGQVADRYLNAERALAGLLVLGGLLNLVLARVQTFETFLLVSVAYSVAYMPTLSLSNSIAFQNLADPERQFPRVRLWGTIGWIVASVGFTTLYLDTSDPVENTRRMADALTVSAVLSFVYGAFALFVLPKTPPKSNAISPLAFARAFGLLGHPVFLLVTLVALPVAMIHQIYFIRGSPFFEAVVGVSKSKIGLVLAIGQASEIGFLVVLGYFIKRLGYKSVLILGCVGYALRFGIFSLGTPGWLVIASQALHGVCYGCFFAASFLLVEKIAPADIRHSAQTVFGIIILGLGPILAGVYNGVVLGRFEHDGVVRYGPIWAIEAGVALAAAAALLALFPNRFSHRARLPAAAEHHAGKLA